MYIQCNNVKYIFIHLSLLFTWFDCLLSTRSCCFYFFLANIQILKVQSPPLKTINCLHTNKLHICLHMFVYVYVHNVFVYIFTCIEFVLAKFVFVLINNCISLICSLAVLYCLIWIYLSLFLKNWVSTIRVDVFV